MSLLKVTNLGKSFGGIKAVDGISFELAAGELLNLLREKVVIVNSW